MRGSVTCLENSKITEDSSRSRNSISLRFSRVKYLRGKVQRLGEPLILLDVDTSNKYRGFRNILLWSTSHGPHKFRFVQSNPGRQWFPRKFPSKFLPATTGSSTGRMLPSFQGRRCVRLTVVCTSLETVKGSWKFAGASLKGRRAPESV